MPAPHALYSKMLAERTASRNVLVLFYFILFYYSLGSDMAIHERRKAVVELLQTRLMEASDSCACGVLVGEATR
jgi:hypothetical protein